MEHATGDFNTVMGFQAGRHHNTGDNNTFIGNSAGRENTAGSGNVFLGSFAGFYETGSNKLYIANSDTETPLIYGDFDTGTVEINDALRLRPRSGPPSDPQAGTMYMDSSLGNKLRVYDGSAWHDLW